MLHRIFSTGKVLLLLILLHKTSTSAESGKYPSIWKEEESASSHAESRKQWAQRREILLQEWHQILGPWPALEENPGWEVLEELQDFPDGQHSRIRLRWTPLEWTEGHLLVPEGPGPFPAVMVVFYEPETALGKGKPDRDFALQLFREGFAVLSLGTTEASRKKTYSLYHPSLQAAEVQPLSMLACAAAQARIALARHPKVDPERIGITGHSFGGKWALFASCLDEGFACAVWSDPGIVFDETRPSVNYWTSWYLGYEPGLWRSWEVPDAQHPRTGAYKRLVESGRDLHELHALMAPRPFLVLGGSEDPPHRDAALKPTREVYQKLGLHPDRVKIHHREEHSPNAESNQQMREFFKYWLQKPEGVARLKHLETPSAP